MKIGGIGTHDSEIVADLNALVGSYVEVEFHARTEHGVEILAQYGSSSQLSVGWGKTVKVPRNVEGDGRLLYEGDGNVARVDGIAVELNLRDRVMVASVENTNPSDFAVRMADGGEHSAHARVNLIFVNVAQLARS